MTRKRKNKLNKLLLAGVVVVIVIIGINFYLISELKEIETGDTPKKMRMILTEWDKAKARELMDINGDGKCDSCGMPIEQCVASGMMQCTMDPKARIGLLESQHIHADWKIYLDGKELNLSSYSHMQRMREGKNVSSFIHVDEGGTVEKTGDTIHMHATGVPLSFFFESIGMKFEKGCLTIENKQYCGIKMYVNGQENNELENYVLKDKDKLLITNGENIEEQMNTITNFAEAH